MLLFADKESAAVLEEKRSKLDVVLKNAS